MIWIMTPGTSLVKCTVPKKVYNNYGYNGGDFIHTFKT